MESQARHAWLAADEIEPRPQSRNLVHRIIALPRRLLTGACNAYLRRLEYDRLMAMSQHQLHDIGLTRSDVVAAYKYGRWNARSRYGD